MSKHESIKVRPPLTVHKLINILLQFPHDSPVVVSVEEVRVTDAGTHLGRDAEKGIVAVTDLCSRIILEVG